jgi:hypothetical protein
VKPKDVSIGQCVIIRGDFVRAGEIATVEKYEGRNRFCVVFDDGAVEKFNAYWLEPAPTRPST